MTSNKHNIIFYISLALAIWFTLTAYAWTYYMNVFISFPFGIISFILWQRGKKNDPNSKRYRYIAIILAIGVVVSLVALAGFMLRG
jgi:hypothetical protein